MMHWDVAEDQDDDKLQEAKSEWLTELQVQIKKDLRSDSHQIHFLRKSEVWTVNRLLFSISNRFVEIKTKEL